MPFTPVPDKKDGDVWTEAMWDTFIRDNLNFLSDLGIKGYAEKTSDTTITAGTNEATAITIAETANIIFDGVSLCEIEWFVPGMDSADDISFWLYQGAVSIGRAAVISSQPGHQVGGRRRLISPAGTYKYSIRASIGGASGRSCRGGAGGAGNYMPAYIRVTYGCQN